MSEQYPPFDFNPSRPESHEDELKVGIWLHETRVELGLIDREQASIRTFRVLGKQVKADGRQFVQTVYHVGDETQPMHQNYQQIWLHIPKHSILHTNVTDVIARFPLFDDFDDDNAQDPEPYPLPAGETYWNDVALELKYAAGVAVNYWYNSRGIVAYESADDVTPIFPHAYGETDLFKVDPNPKLAAYELNAKTLLALLQASIPLEQPIDPDEL